MSNKHPGLLRPYDARETMEIADLARLAKITGVSARAWCERFGLGRKIAGRWRVSRVATHLHLAGNEEALAAYLAGDRDHPEVVAAFAELGIPLRRPHAGDGGGA